MAAISLWVPKFSEEEYRKVNVEGTRTVAEAAKRAGVRKLVYSSTGAVYPILPDYRGKFPIVEEDAPTFQEELDPYGRSKLLSEEALNEYSPPLDIIILRVDRHNFNCASDSLLCEMFVAAVRKDVKGHLIINAGTPVENEQISTEMLRKYLI